MRLFRTILNLVPKLAAGASNYTGVSRIVATTIGPLRTVKVKVGGLSQGHEHTWETLESI